MLYALLALKQQDFYEQTIAKLALYLGRSYIRQLRRRLGPYLLAALVSLIVDRFELGRGKRRFCLFGLPVVICSAGRASFLLCRKLIRKYVHADYDSTGKVLFR